MIRFALLALFILIIQPLSNAQNIDYNIQNRYIASGYDVIEYFNNKAVKGKKSLSYKHNGATYLFSRKENLNAFKENPNQYIPQYGGWCAYAMGKKNQKVNVNPKTFEIRDGKLYLFYNAYFNNTLTSWKKENPELLQAQGDKNWQVLKHQMK